MTDTNWPSLKDLDAARAKAYRQGKQWEVTDAIVDDIVDAFWQSLRAVSPSPVPAEALKGDVADLLAWLEKRGEPNSGINYQGRHSDGRQASVVLHGTDADFIAKHFHGLGATALLTSLRTALHRDSV